MKLYAVTLVSSLLMLNACDQTSSQIKTSAATQKSIAEQAIDAAISSPETAYRLAVSSPEAVALAAARAAEVTAKGAAAAPESSLVKVKAYAKLAKVAASSAPESIAARDAALQANSQIKIVESLISVRKKK